MPEEKSTPGIETPEVAPEGPPSKPQLRDKRTMPAGVVPKQAQGYVIAGLAVLILMAVMFSKNHAKSASKVIDSGPLAMSTDMNQRKIQELEQDLTADQRQSQQQALLQKSMNSGTAAGGNPSLTQASGATGPTGTLPPAAGPASDPVADAEKALAFKSRFASNLVSAEDNASHSQPESTDLESSSATRSSSSPASAPTQAAAAPAPAAGKRPQEVNVNSAHGQPFVIFEGTSIDTVLVNRLDGEFAGPVKVMVTNPVYSQDRQQLLIPEGTFILGDVQKVGGLRQKRLAVTFHRLLMPDGYSVDLDQFHGLDQAGATGLKDQVNNHYIEIFGASIALGVIAGAAEATNANAAYEESGTEAYKQGIASSLSQTSANVLDHFINIPPTISIREGHRIKVYITQDMLLPAYENHAIPNSF